MMRRPLVAGWARVVRSPLRAGPGRRGSELRLPRPNRRSIVSFVVITVGLAAPALAEAPQVALEEQAVRIEGATPEGRLVVFTVGKPPGQLMPVTGRSAEIVRADATGAVRVDLPAPVPARSVWAVVDVESGELALAAPEAIGLREVGFPSRGIGTTRRFLRDQRRLVDVLVVRPAVGSPNGGTDPAEAGGWTRTFGDGGEADGDGEADGTIQAPLDRLRPIGDSPILPPEELRPGDVAVVVDSVTLEVYGSRLSF